MVLSWRSPTSIHCWKWRKYLAGGSSKRKDALSIPSKIVKEGYFLFAHPDIRTFHPSLSSPFPRDWPSWIIFNEPPCPLTSSWIWPIGSPTRDVALFLSWVITPVGWSSPTIRALADFWLWCASPSLFTTRSGSGSKWMLHHPLFVSINPAHTNYKQVLHPIPFNHPLLNVWPAACWNPEGCWQELFFLWVENSQSSQSDLNKGRWKSFVHTFKKNFSPAIPSYLAITGETYKLPGAIQPRSIMPFK